MGYADKKAPKRDSLSDMTNPKSDLNSDVKLRGNASKQEQSTGRGAKREAVTSKNAERTGYTGADRVVGNLAKIGPNTKGTDTLKDPLNAYRSKTMPAVENTDPKPNRTNSTKAPGRNTGKPRP